MTYKVTQAFMDALIKWRDESMTNAVSGSPFEFVTGDDVKELRSYVGDWWYESNDSIERNKRLIAIIEWLNGEDVFEVEKPHKFVVRSIKADKDGDYRWMNLQNGFYDLDIPNYRALKVYRAKKFDTRMDAELWTTNGYEVVEIDGDGNEVK